MTKKRHRTWLLITIMILYAVVVLVGAKFGLHKLTQFLEVYETSRPSTAMTAYMDGLTTEHICDMSKPIIDIIDHNLQSEEECRQVILDALQGSFSYAKKIADCSDEKQVYVIRCDSQPIGQMQIEQKIDMDFGMKGWIVTGENFDLSYLITDTVSGTVPSNYGVYVNNVLLDGSYLTKLSISTDAIPEYYGIMGLPTMVTYTAGPCLGNIEMTVLDPYGEGALADQDPMSYLMNVTPDETDRLNAFTHDFLVAYMDFLAKKWNDSYGNYNRLQEYLVPDGVLADRMYQAIEGMIWITDRSASMDDYHVDFVTRVDSNHYFVDVTYTFTELDFYSYSGWSTLTDRLNLIIQETPEGLYVEEVESR